MRARTDRTGSRRKRTVYSEGAAFRKWREITRRAERGEEIEIQRRDGFRVLVLDSRKIGHALDCLLLALRALDRRLDNFSAEK